MPVVAMATVDPVATEVLSMTMAATLYDGWQPPAACASPTMA